ncbi:MAG TPA: LysM peptidoglycan-binding domain-containing protein, partial [Terriglobales bacterium]
MKTPARILLIGSILVAFALIWAAVSPVHASNFAFQTQPTPTPGADGRILYLVVAGDTQLGIAEKFGIDVNLLRQLNNWTAETPVIEGQTILLGDINQQLTATVAPTSEVVATVTEQAPGSGMICVLLFDDVNGDALRQETEFGIAGGQASVSERTGLASRTDTTRSELDADGAPVATCFEELPLGEYTVSVAAPQGYNPTTSQSATIQLNPGDATTLNFGAQASSTSGLGALTPEEGGRSPLMGLLGIVLL